MSEPLTTTNQPEHPDADIQPFEFDFGPVGLGDAVPVFDQDLAETHEEFIAQTLSWCTEVFQSSRARFIRPIDNGAWVVYTRHKENGSVLAHLADQAEIAMAYTVGLSKQPLVVSRPRISKSDGSGLRPIALKSYLGIPLVCQDRLIGVIEFAGDIRPDMDAALYSASNRLANVSERLLFDPGLRRRKQPITLDTTVILAGGVWSRGNIVIQPEEMRFLAAITHSMSVAAIAETSEIDPDRALSLTNELLERGLLAVTTS